MSTENRWRWIVAPIVPAILVTIFLLGTILGLLAFFQKSPENPGKDERKQLGPALFQDMTADSGVNFAYRNDFDGNPGANPPWPGHFAILDSLGGGLGLIDVYGDLRPPEQR